MNLLASLPKIRLTKAQEFALATKLQKRPTEDLLNELVLDNMEEGFIYTKGVCRGRIPDDEIFSLVYKTLYRNAKRFQPRPGGIRFLAFAKAGLRGALSRYWTGINTVRNAKAIFSLSTNNGYSCPYFGDEDVANPSLMEDGEPTTDPEFDAIQLRERLAFVKAAMEKKLSAQERMVIDLVYNQSFNFQEVGDLLGVTRSAIQSMHAESLKKIRQELTRKRLLVD